MDSGLGRACPCQYNLLLSPAIFEYLSMVSLMLDKSDLGPLNRTLSLSRLSSHSRIAQLYILFALSLGSGLGPAAANGWSAQTPEYANHVSCPPSMRLRLMQAGRS